MLIVFLINSLVLDQINLYEIYPPIDIPMHTLGGIVAAWSVHRFIKIYFKKELSGLFVSWILLGSGGVIAIFWETSEMLSDMYLGTHTQLGSIDTTVDLLLGLLGALIYIILARPKKI